MPRKDSKSRNLGTHVDHLQTTYLFAQTAHSQASPPCRTTCILPSELDVASPRVQLRCRESVYSSWENEQDGMLSENSS